MSGRLRASEKLTLRVRFPRTGENSLRDFDGASPAMTSGHASESVGAPGADGAVRGGGGGAVRARAGRSRRAADRAEAARKRQDDGDSVQGRVREPHAR